MIRRDRAQIEYRALLRAAAIVIVFAFCIVAGNGTAGAAESLGRLFFTPQQRQDLDRRREANAQESAVSAESMVTVNGRVSRSSGKSTTWINGVPQNDSHRSRDPAKIRLGGGDGEAPVDLRIGETLDKGRGEVKDGLEGGTIRIDPTVPRRQ